MTFPLSVCVRVHLLIWKSTIQQPRTMAQWHTFIWWSVECMCVHCALCIGHIWWNIEALVTGFHIDWNIECSDWVEKGELVCVIFKFSHQSIKLRWHVVLAYPSITSSLHSNKPTNDQAKRTTQNYWSFTVLFSSQFLFCFVCVSAFVFSSRGRTHYGERAHKMYARTAQRLPLLNFSSSKSLATS